MPDPVPLIAALQVVVARFPVLLVDQYAFDPVWDHVPVTVVPLVAPVPVPFVSHQTVVCACMATGHNTPATKATDTVNTLRNEPHLGRRTTPSETSNNEWRKRSIFSGRFTIHAKSLQRI